VTFLLKFGLADFSISATKLGALVDRIQENGGG